MENTLHVNDFKSNKPGKWKSNLFLIKYFLYLDCGCMTLDFPVQMTSSHHFLPHANE